MHFVLLCIYALLSCINRITRGQDESCAVQYDANPRRSCRCGGIGRRAGLKIEIKVRNALAVYLRAFLRLLNRNRA